jgi:hypothetical protein
MSAEAEVPSQFTHSIKLSETAKGIRIDVHVYANSAATAINEALDTYISMKAFLKSNNIQLAPVEVDKK